MRTMVFTLVPLLLFFTCYSMQASVYGVLTGKITDDQGNPLVGATVLIEGTSRGGYTKSNGTFTILKITPGSYTVRIKSLGFKDHTEKVVVAADQTTQIAVALKPDAKRCEEIRVTAERFADPGMIGSVRSIRTDHSTYAPSARIQSTVAKQSGVTTTVPGIHIRGGRTSASRYRINGLDVNDEFVGSRNQTFTGDSSTTSTVTAQRTEPVFTNTTMDNRSTFGMDVDNASYTLARSLLHNDMLPPQQGIRPEEFLNYFDYGYAAPCEDEFAVSMECAPSMFAADSTHFLKIGIKARELYNDERSAAVLTFVIDISGSMSDDLPMIQTTLKGLVNQLRRDDIVSIITFGSDAEVHLKPTSVAQRGIILGSIDALRITGSTNVGAGMKLGYETAEATFDKSRINRVIFLGDGVANNGLTKSDDILQTISESAARGIALTILGIGMGGYNDALMEELADRGDGKYFYIDSERELNAVLNYRFTGLLDDVARDAKIQVEFDPLVVESYRLIGYDNRALADSLFRDDTQDAGEVGAGHTVTALYEVKFRPGGEGKIARTAIRYFIGRSAAVREIHEDISTQQVQQSYSDGGYSFRLAVVAAKFAEFLRGTYRNGQSVAQLVEYADEVSELSGGLPEVKELSDNVKKTALLAGNAVAAGK